MEQGTLGILSGTTVHLRISDAERERGKLRDRRELAFAPGSSGWTGASGKEVRYMELFLRGGSAREAFARLNSGARLEISATS